MYQEEVDWRIGADEDKLGIAKPAGVVGRVPQTTGAQVAAHDCLQLRFTHQWFGRIQGLDFVWLIANAKDLVAHVGKARRDNGGLMPGADDANFGHDSLFENKEGDKVMRGNQCMNPPTTHYLVEGRLSRLFICMRIQHYVPCNFSTTPTVFKMISSSKYTERLLI